MCDRCGLRQYNSWKEGLLALYRCVFVESNQSEHFAGFFAGFGVFDEVLHEDFWGGVVRALCDYRPTLSSTNVRGRRLALVTTAMRSPPLHRRTALKASLLAFL